MQNVEVIKNYLSEDSFNEVYETIHKLPWILQKKMNPDSSHEGLFVFMQDYTQGYIKNISKDISQKIFNKLLSPYAKNKASTVRVFRCKTNLFINILPYSHEGGFHVDVQNAKDSIYTLLLYLEDSNGATEFKNSGEKIISEKNKAIIFPCSLQHQTIFQTDILFRSNININFELVPKD